MCPNKTSTTSDVATIGQIKTKVTKFQQKKTYGKHMCYGSYEEKTTRESKFSYPRNKNYSPH